MSPLRQVFAGCH
ncbi:unnamed protein product [Timema podura]|uniref:Uncharacterized protein n=1 Tax=Timema podura TaxID=61482 RepID=A0ABN7PV56_TIMPD|nr:unnamed protein product [Timema podura]